MATKNKRKADARERSHSDKKLKTGKNWRTPKAIDRGARAGGGAQGIEPGDAGIWATCEIGKEGKCVGELRDILEEHAEILYGAHQLAGNDDEDHEERRDDIEAAIREEVREMKRPKARKLFTAVRIDNPCIVFFKTQKPVDPVLLVQRICEDAFSSPGLKKSRFIKRLTPMCLMSQASEKGLDEIAAKVLAPHFYREDGISRKFAIRPTIRCHKTLTREFVINRVAAAVGTGHTVDLSHYDLLILVDVYKNICGMSVVQAGYDRLRRYNLAELYDPTPAPKSSVTASGSDRLVAIPNCDRTGADEGSRSSAASDSKNTDGPSPALEKASP